MNINIDSESLAEKNLSPSEYCVLACIKNGKNPKDVFCCIADEVYLNLTYTAYLREDPFDESTYPYKLTGEGLKLFEEPNDFNAFVEEYRNLFPKGVKSGNGTPIKGDKQGVIKKMEWFLRTYPEYSKSTILAATKIYIQQMERRGYVYMTQADYFIQKENGSKLAAMCEDFDAKTANMVTTGERRR
jgi:hypothetical protein